MQSRGETDRKRDIRQTDKRPGSQTASWAIRSKQTESIKEYNIPAEDRE